MMMGVSFSFYGLILFPVLALLAHRWPKQETEIIEESRVGIIRRLAAFSVDISVALISILPIICMPTLFLEFLVTGEWQWSFERDLFRITDVLNFVILLLGFFAIFYYFKWHFMQGKQTLGQYLLKFKLVPMEGTGSMTMRALVAWINFSWWPIWPWTILKRKQDYWWDMASNIKARRTKPL